MEASNYETNVQRDGLIGHTVCSSRTAEATVQVSVFVVLLLCHACVLLIKVSEV